MVTRNYSEKSINGILDYVGDGGKKGKGRKVAATAATQGVDVEVLQKFYEVTKASLEDTKNDVSQSDISLPLRLRQLSGIAIIFENQPKARKTLVR